MALVDVPTIETNDTKADSGDNERWIAGDM